MLLQGAIYISPLCFILTSLNLCMHICVCACMCACVYVHYRFLDEVQSHSSQNKMSVQNLATVFGPNIFRPKMEDPQIMMEGRYQHIFLCDDTCYEQTNHNILHRGDLFKLKLVFYNISEKEALFNQSLKPIYVMYFSANQQPGHFFALICGMRLEKGFSLSGVRVFTQFVQNLTVCIRHVKMYSNL